MENEKRLIAYDPITFESFIRHATKHIDPYYDPYGEGFTDAVDSIEGWLNNNTVDAVEVVHGRWEDEHGGKYANPRYRCSVCKKRALYKSERDLLDNWKEVQALTPFCPYCMAKLEGGTDNDI